MSALRASKTVAAVGISLAMLLSACSKAGDRTDDARPAGTIFASLGTIVDFQSFEQVQVVLGWTPLRPNGAEYTLVRHGGIVRTYPEIGLPRLEQFYTVDGRSGLLQFVQEPTSYRSAAPGGDVSDATIGSWVGKLWRDGDQAGFMFLSGGVAQDGTQIRASVYGDGFSTADIRAFVSALDTTSVPEVYP